MQKLINTLKKSNKIKTIYITDDKKLATIENHKGTVIDINAKTYWNNKEKKSETYGYQWHYPIKPNLTTGSGMTGTGDYFDYIDFDKMVEVAEDMTVIIPNFYSTRERETIKMQSMEDNLKNYTFYSVKIK